ncbi:linoleate 9S-lipoxygenase [Ranunculus cassubicifolius]
MCPEFLLHILNSIKSRNENPRLEDGVGRHIIKGSIVLMKKSVLDFNDFQASFKDHFDEFLLNNKVCLQLVSASNADPEHRLGAKHGRPAYLKRWNKDRRAIAAGESVFTLTLDWDEELGVPGAVVITNYHSTEFFLKSITMEDIPGVGRMHFICNSWVYPHKKHQSRVFFSNKTYLPGNTPGPLRKYREEELAILRGSGTGKLEEWHRVYDYAYYNDLGDPSKKESARQVLGGTSEFPYPRRGRTGRPATKNDPDSEERLFLLRLDIYVPRDEKFGHLKMSDFLGYALKSVAQVFLAQLKNLDRTPTEFDSFNDVLNLYEGRDPLPDGVAETFRQCVPFEILKEIIRSDGEGPAKFPMPQVIKENPFAWRTDEEFAREMLAGLNPVCIRHLKSFPPTSTLDPEKYGNHTSSITKEHIEKNLDGLTVDEALSNNRLFILDHHDALMVYLNRINSTNTKTYATRTLLFLQKDGTLKPLAIELSLSHPQGEKYGAVSKVCTPAERNIEGSVWQLAKAYAGVNDSGYHQLISHWLNTHAVIEPFVIATNRQLSVLHPIHKLLNPHFRDTMNINALARQTLINAGGVLEMTVFPGKFAMEMSSVIYKNWIFTEQGLPEDLLKRGLAVPDPTRPHGLRLLIEDYPFAVDGLEVWSAIKTWVHEYCSFYYRSDEVIKDDCELQCWWKEIREVGHGDKKYEPWWPKMETVDELIQSCTIIIWIASALHAAVNFGQYAYAGYLPNRPTVSRRFMPEPGTPEYKELESDPEKAFMKTITSQLQQLLGVSLIEILSRHSTDEVYLGQRSTTEWTLDAEPLEAFKRFGEKLVEIEKRILELNEVRELKNRRGPVNVPYTLLFPNTSNTISGGLAGHGIPNSVSI